MKALISAFHEKTNCSWCQKETEAVSVEFDGGFLRKGPLCWRCLQQAVRVHAKQQADGKQAAANQASAAAHKSE